MNFDKQFHLHTWSTTLVMVSVTGCLVNNVGIFLVVYHIPQGTTITKYDTVSVFIIVCNE